MFLLYNITLIFIAVMLSPVILVAFIIQPKLRAGFWQKIGFYRFKQNGRPTYVFHAVSVGETNAIELLVKKFREKNPDVNIIFTTTTKTGQQVANSKLKDVVDKITYFPYDFIFSVNSFLKVFKPEKIIIAETEIWPCFVTYAHRKGIKVYIVNGRISPRSYIGYKKYSKYLAPVLNEYEALLMQTNSDAKKIIDIGASPNRVKVMGNLKYDIVPNMSFQEIKDLWLELGINDSKVFIAASTHAGEDEIILDVFLKAKQRCPELKLLLAPRHPQRYMKVEELLNSTGLSYGKRSRKDTFEDNEIILLNTMGELAKMFSICYVAFIGGSFSRTGGHNPLEASIWGKPVISGPNVFNFKEVYKLLKKKRAAVIVNKSEDLLRELLTYIFDPVTYKVGCASSAKIFEENKGAIDFVLKEIS